MNKVLLVDDEYRMLNLLGTEVPWARYGMEVVSTATNGRNALAYIEEHDVDIVFTDIKMPVMDGISLIENARLIKPSSRVVVLSSYNEFSLVKSAFRAGAIDYILKDDIVSDTMCSLLENLQASQLQGLNLSNSLQRYIADRMKNDREYTGAQKVMISIISCTSAHQESLVRDTLRKIEEEHRVIWFFSADKFVVVFFVEGYTAAHDPMLRNRVREMLQTDLGQERCTVSFSDIGLFSRIDGLYEQVKKRMEKLAFYALEFSVSGEKDIGDLETAASRAKVRMYGQLERMEIAGIKNTVSDFLRFVEENHFEKAIVQDKILDIFLYITNHIFDYNLLPGKVSHNAEVINHTICGFNQYTEVKRWVQEQLAFIEDYYRQEKNEHLMELVKVYIEHNYCNELALGDAARHFGISEGYLSRKFVDVNGVHFKEYINILRNEKAKTLLKQTDLKLTDICDEIGFANVEHFSRMFKKYTGVSPVKYRQY